MKYKILTKSKKFYWTANSVFFFIMITTAIPLFVKLNLFKAEKITFFEESLVFIMISTFAISLIYGISKFNKFVTLKGELLSDLEFEIDKIIINDKEYPLDKIDKIEINAFDFKGAYSGYRNFDGTLSNGVDNTIKIYLTDKNKIEHNFQQKVENEIRNEKSLLINYCKKGKLHYLSLLEILGITEYEEIQKFKKENLIEFKQ